MSKISDNLNKILDIEPEDIEYTGEDIVVPDPHAQLALPAPSNTDITISDSDTQDDYILARQTFRKILDMGEKAAKDLNAIARESENARTYEVMSTMMNTMRETAKDLMNNQEVKRKLVGAPDKKVYEAPGGVTIDKAVFVGTLSEIMDAKKNDH